jgi:small subunit ribosomal protein S2
MNQTLPSLEEMYEAGVHFGHRTRRWHPKMKPFIYGIKEGVHLINLEKTYSQLEKALDLINRSEKEDLKPILLVGTKRQAAMVVKKLAQEHSLPYITDRWPGGLITNFDSIKKTIQRYIDIVAKIADTKVMAGLNNKSKFELLKEKARLEKVVGGLVQIEREPRLIILVDPKREKTAVHEARITNTKTIAIVDTNTDPSLVDIAIPANDDALRSIELILNSLIAGIKATNKQGTPEKPITQAKKKAKK